MSFSSAEEGMADDINIREEEADSAEESIAKVSTVWVENTTVICPFYIPRSNVPSLMFCLVGADLNIKKQQVVC